MGPVHFLPQNNYWTTIWGVRKVFLIKDRYTISITIFVIAQRMRERMLTKLVSAVNKCMVIFVYLPKNILEFVYKFESEYVNVT